MSEARDRLLQAIKDVDAEVCGERQDDEMLTNYVVLVAHRKMAGDPDDDRDGITRLSMPGQPVWQTLGLLRASTRYAEVQLTADEED